MKAGTFTFNGMIKVIPAIFLFYLFSWFIFPPASAQGENWRLETLVPTPRHDVASSVVDGKIYVIGGMSHEYAAEQTYFDRVSRYDLETGIWDVLAPLPEARVGAYACFINDKIYLFGGKPVFSSHNSASVFIYDIEKDQWTSGTDMRWGTCYAGGCVYDNKVYLIGGLKEGTTGWSPTNTVLRYDPAQDSWDSLANMNQALAMLSVSVTENKIYAIGGLHHMEEIFYDVVEEYDPVSNEWISKNPVPAKIGLHVNVVFNDRIWVMSGTSSFSNTFINSVYIYEPAADKWSTSVVKEDVPSFNFWDPELVTHDKKLYLLCGGNGIEFGDVQEVIEFDFPVARVISEPPPPIEILFYEEGEIYVTPPGTPADKDDIIEAAGENHHQGTAGQTITLQLDTGSYWIYGIASDGRLDRGYSSIRIVNSDSEESIPDFRFYPNPARDYITVDLPIKGDICLLDILGRKMAGISEVMGETTLSISELSPGVYFLRVSDGYNYRVKKVVVE